MNKQELLNKINGSACQVKEVRNSLFHGKCYIVATNYIQGIFKTKRGAEGYIKRNSGKSYYDEYLQELVYPSAGECFEVLETEIIEVANNKMFWYKQLRKENYNIICGLGENLIYEAKQSNVSDEIMNYIKESIKSLENNQSLTVYEEEQPVEVVETIEIVTEVENNNTGSVSETQTTNTNNSLNVEVKFNIEKNGIELYFNEKPSEEIRNQLKVNCYRWAKFNKCWYVKDSESAREFLKVLGLLNNEGQQEDNTIETEELKEIVYPEIDINDIESYIVDEKLSKRENNLSMFRRENKDHNQEIQSIMLKANSGIIEALKDNNKPYIEYKAKQYLQSWKKKYYSLYIKMLTHKANNPSWMVTGRGNLNVNRYNKKQSQYEKMIGESVKLTEEFNKKISSIEWQIQKQFQEQEKKETKKIMNSDIDISKFEKKIIKYNVGAVDNIFNNPNKENKVNYYQGYYIFNNWGCWRCYNEQGKEIFQTKTTGTLLEAKKKLIVLLNNQNNIAI